MPILHAIILGITQGLSEFLPISSSGHLRLVPWLFGWDDFATNPGFKQTFDVALHLGTLLGAVAYFRADLLRLAAGGLSTLRPRARSLPGVAAETSTTPAPGPLEPGGDQGRLAWLLLLTAVPAGLLGLVFEETADRIAREEWVIGTLLVVFGFVLLWADRLGGERTADHFGPRDAVVLGMAQALALVPGVSRSGATITAGRWSGFDRDAAARLSFLMSLPVIAGALLLKGLDVVDHGVPAGYRAAFVWGIVASGITGWLAVWATLRVIRTRTFTPFVVYRVIVGTGVLVLVVSGLR